MRVWIAVAVVGAGTIALKGLGPALLGTQRLPERVGDLVTRVVGVGAAAAALALRAPLIVVVVLAAVATAVARALG